MGFSYVKNRDETSNGIVELICDTQADVAKLPINPASVAPGSKAKVISNGKTYIFNSKFQWTLLNDGGGSGGGGDLPANFPTEGPDNANKIIGFDNEGNYTAKNESSGGAEKFVVTLTQEDETLTADKSIAEICEAADANKVVVARYDADGTNIELPIYGWQTPSVVAFASVDGEGETFFSGVNDGNADVWEQTNLEFIDKNNFPAEGVANANKFLGFDENGDYVAKDAPSNLLTLVATMSQTEQSKNVFTFDITATELYTALSYGKFVKTTGQITPTGGFEFVNSMAASCVTVDNVTTYGFRITDENGLVYSVANLAGSDTVVLTEE